MKNYPSMWSLRELFEHANTCDAEINDRWVPVRPLGFSSLRTRFRIAWEVFVGRADAFKWPEGQ